jgi:hypothetical protein
MDTGPGFFATLCSGRIIGSFHTIYFVVSQNLLRGGSVNALFFQVSIEGYPVSQGFVGSKIPAMCDPTPTAVKESPLDQRTGRLPFSGRFPYLQNNAVL